AELSGGPFPKPHPRVAVTHVRWRSSCVTPANGVQSECGREMSEHHVMAMGKFAAFLSEIQIASAGQHVCKRPCRCLGSMTGRLKATPKGSEMEAALALFPEALPAFRRRRRQPKYPPLAKIGPSRSAPAIGPGAAEA